MSHRGTKAHGEKVWQARMRRDGYSAGYADGRAIYSNGFYQEGYRRGVEARKRDEAARVV